MSSGPFSKYSYVRRRGRATAGQLRALEQEFERYAVTLDEIQSMPGSPASFGIEVGFGMGDALTQWAKLLPTWRFLGIDLYRPGVGSLVNKLVTHELANVRVANLPAQEVFSQLTNDSVDEVRILFPDPWPKKKHAKRRLIQTEFVSDVARCLTTSGVLRIATDWDPYGEWIREVIAGVEGLTLVEDRVRESEDSSVRETTTKFEQRGQSLGHRIHDLCYQSSKNSATTESK
ncbi:MAG: tRNA (guanosine(46)-N7)-methyltransferase TrmB [Pseudomonadales bacterium]|nr:tRNA (guanosine(46)-N7)-methyltransferase TrmB [Pseudomonadales bacterium]